MYFVSRLLADRARLVNEAITAKNVALRSTGALRAIQVRQRDHRDLAQRGFERGVDDRDEARIDHAAGQACCPVLHAVVEPDVRQRQNTGGKRQQNHDIGDRTARHQWSEQHHADERQARVISDSTDKNCWSKPSRSIRNHVAPAPGSGTARNTKMISAVPTSARALARGSFWTSW